MSPWMSNGFIAAPQGYRLAITENIIPGSPYTALVLHGFYSSRDSENVKAGAQRFNDLGISTVCPDMYGRGESDGTFGELTIEKGIEAIAACLEHIRQKNPEQKIILTGGSFGGLLAMYAAAQFKDDIGLLILRAPVSDWRYLWDAKLSEDDFTAWDKTGSYTAELPWGDKATFGRDFYADLLRNDIYDKIAPAIRVPTLIVHGNQDTVVPLAQSEELKKHIPMSDLVVVEGADHGFSHETDLMIYQHHIENFLRKSRLI